MKRILIAGFIAVMMVGGLSPAWGMRELSDAELDSVTAGTNGTSEMVDGPPHFQFGKEPSHNSILGDGAVSMLEGGLPSSGSPGGVLNLEDNAQGNLRALVNVNAVNSIIQILLNLNVIVNSNVGGIEQLNISKEF